MRFFASFLTALTALAALADGDRAFFLPSTHARYDLCLPDIALPVDLGPQFIQRLLRVAKSVGDFVFGYVATFAQRTVEHGFELVAGRAEISQPVEDCQKAVQYARDGAR